MIEPSVEKSITVNDVVERVFISDTGKVMVIKYGSGYSIIHSDGIIEREEDARVQLIRDRETVVVANGKMLSFYNATGTLLWRSTYDEDIRDMAFKDGQGIVLLKDRRALLIGGYSTVLNEIKVRDDARYVKKDPSGRYFAVVGVMGLDMYSFSTMGRIWHHEFMEEISHIELHRSANRTAVSLKTGDFYLLNKNGKRILEYKFKETPRAVFDVYGNVVVAEDEKIRIMNERGTILRIFETRGRCRDLRASAGADYMVCGTDRGVVYFFDRSDILWSYEHKDGIYAVDITPAGEYVVTANREVMVFSNLAYYLALLKETQNKLGTLERSSPHYARLSELFGKMKSAYLKKDFKVMMSLKKVFDGIYNKLERERIAYAFVTDSLFFPEQISKNMLYVKMSGVPRVKVYGDVRYRVDVLAPHRDVKRYRIILQPKKSGTVPVKLVISGPTASVSFTTRIYADGVPRKKRVISNTDYRRLIS